MGYLGMWNIGDTLTFAVNTHTAGTGAEKDGDSVPTYRIYEDETATPILTGSMALLDDANTTGFYSEAVVLSAANGFEVGKSYNIRVTATVAGVPGSEVFFFQVVTPVWAQTPRTLTQAAASVNDAVSGDEVTAYRGTSWSIGLTGLGDLSAYTKIYFSVKRWLHEADDAALVRVSDEVSGLKRINGAAPSSATNGTITIDDEAAGDITITVEAAETANLPLVHDLVYDVKGIGTDVDVKSSGTFNIAGDVTRAIS